MRNLLGILVICLLIVSCNRNIQTDIESEIVMKIMNQSEIADSNLAILNFKQGQINQYSHNDTIDLILNGFLYGKLICQSDSSEFNMFPESAPLFKFQGLWDSETVNVKSLKLDNLVKVDSISGLGENQPDSIFNFDWTTISQEINGFTAFSKPVLGNDNNGFISQMIYTRSGKLYMKLYRVEYSEDCTLIKYGCKSFKVIAFYISVSDNMITNIEPKFIIIDDPC